MFSDSFTGYPGTLSLNRVVLRGYSERDPISSAVTTANFSEWCFAKQFHFSYPTLLAKQRSIWIVVGRQQVYCFGDGNIQHHDFLAINIDFLDGIA